MVRDKPVSTRQPLPALRRTLMRSDPHPVAGWAVCHRHYPPVPGHCYVSPHIARALPLPSSFPHAQQITRGIDLTLTVTWCTAALFVLGNGAVVVVWGCRVLGERRWVGLLVLGLERRVRAAAEEIRCREHRRGWAALAEKTASRSDAYRRAVFLSVPVSDLRNAFF